MVKLIISIPCRGRVSSDVHILKAKYICLSFPGIFEIYERCLIPIIGFSPFLLEISY